MKENTATITAPYRIDYLYRPGPGPLIILLHGYGQKAQTTFDELVSVIPEDYAVLAPNGPFPLPGKTRTLESLGFAWYFYDSEQDQYYISYKVPAQIVRSLVHDLGIEAQEKIIVGFSQGGYLAPFVAEDLTQVQSVICINSSFRYDFMDKEAGDFLIHAINGADDILVDPIEAKKRHDKLKDLKRHGDFNLIPGTGHRINQAILDKLKDYLR